MGICARVFAAGYWKVNWPVKSGKDHIFLRLGLLRSPYSAQKNVAYARTLCEIAFALALSHKESRARYEGRNKRTELIWNGGIRAAAS
jgi:hypothetical protein